MVGKPEANNLKYYIQRLELIQFKVINLCMSTYDFDMCLVWCYLYWFRIYVET